MLDLKYVCNNFEDVKMRLEARDPSLDITTLMDIYSQRNDYANTLNKVLEDRNKLSRDIGTIRQKGGTPSEDLLSRAESLKNEALALDNHLNYTQKRLDEIALALPNIPHESVPLSPKKEDIEVVRSHGEMRKFDFEPQNHVALGTTLGLLDFERAAKISASGFPMYVGLGAELELALHKLFFDKVVSGGFKPVLPPIMVNYDTLFTAGVVPKFRDQVYECEKDDLFLIPTSEVTLVGLHRGETLSDGNLPLRYMAYTPNFRREAGAAGKRDRGLIRLHQFYKVEMVIFAEPNESYDLLEDMTKIAESIVGDLGLHYRTVLLPAGDLGQQCAKTYDIEVFIPTQNRYYEVSSCSNCEEYQARRGNIRFRFGENGKSRYVHTLNGSGLATSRVFPAILENNQQSDGSVLVPEKLQPYFGGRNIIRPL